MVIVGTKGTSRGEGAGHAGWEFWPATNDGWGKASERRRVLRGGSPGPLQGLGLPSFGVGWEVDWP
jgi:hypothetical protein